MKNRTEPVEVGCSKRKYAEIIYLPKEEVPRCPKCKTQMINFRLTGLLPLTPS